MGQDSLWDTDHMAAKPGSGKAPMSQAHKDALAVGREEGRAVRRYLEAMEAHKPKRGRKRNPDTIEKRLQQIEEKIESADPLTKVHLVQERLNLTSELANKDAAVDLVALEDGFVKAAKNYSERKGITYAAWREAGIDAAVLRKAGIRRSASDL
jgi:hypothetical protein